MVPSYPLYSCYLSYGRDNFKNNSFKHLYLPTMVNFYCNSHSWKASTVLQHWLTTLSVLSARVQNPVGLLVLGCYIKGWLGEAKRIVSSLGDDWLSYLWPGVNGGLPGRGVWCHWGREECDNSASLLARPASHLLAGLTLWSNWLECWLVTLIVQPAQVWNPVGLLVPGRYNIFKDLNMISPCIVRSWDMKHQVMWCTQ